MELIPLLQSISHCDICEKHLPLPPKPVLQIHPSAKILIIGQAPGLKVHESGIPWNDQSGNRLRNWLGVDKTTFYDKAQFAIMPMGFCYPGKGKSGDMPPRKECAPKWHELLLRHLPNIQLILLIGLYSQNYYFKGTDFHKEHKSLTQKVQAQTDVLGRYFLLPHPSPRNQIWLKKNPWFENDTVSRLKIKVNELLS